MPRIYVEFAGLKQIGSNCKTVSSKVGSIRSDFQRTVRQLDWDIKFEADINRTADRIAGKLEQYAQALESYQRFVDDAYNGYVKLDEYKEVFESDLISANDKVFTVKPEGRFQTFSNEFSEKYGWEEALSGSNYISSILNLARDIKNGKSWKDFLKAGMDVYRFLTGAAKTLNNYMKIGNAVGMKTAMAWWAKMITGLKPLGRASEAQNPVTRFFKNLTNKTSPFHAQFKNIIDNFKGANGAGKAVAAWGAVIATGVLNYFSNKEEQANSNGSMSNGRMIAETITETGIDIALTYGAGIVAGAAVTTVAGTVAAPGILIVAASGAVVAAFHAGVKALTGKTTTEWLSDTILDTGEAFCSAVGNVAKNVSESVGRWFEKLSYAYT